MTYRVFLLLGTNLGEKNFNLARAISHIENEVGNVSCASSIYQTAAWGKEDQADFYNQVLEVQTHKSAAEVLDIILSIELKMERKRLELWGERVIDIDLLLHHDSIVELENLIVPHPQIIYRRFTLEPLAEIAGDVVHPVYKKKISELLAACTDQLAVKKL